MSDLLSIGSSAIDAYQRALTTTSNNIANLNTEGYSREELMDSLRERPSGLEILGASGGRHSPAAGGGAAAGGARPAGRPPRVGFRL